MHRVKSALIALPVRITQSGKCITCFRLAIFLVVLRKSAALQHTAGSLLTKLHFHCVCQTVKLKHYNLKSRSTAGRCYSSLLPACLERFAVGSSWSCVTKIKCFHFSNENCTQILPGENHPLFFGWTHTSPSSGLILHHKRISHCRKEKNLKLLASK